ncbi:MAG TPA: DUF5663 domain-containing protein [Candidatus Saccharimonadales bacterium]|nr:DUF5663 domain-containing protein [Candidatus Saccharimonadales bacterium]
MADTQIDNLINELGLGHLSPEQKEQLQEKILETLQMRIGLRLSQDLTDEQLTELEKQFVPDVHDTMEDIQKKQQAVTTWLEQNHPNYQGVVQEESEKLQQDLRSTQDIDSILS